VPPSGSNKITCFGILNNGGISFFDFAYTKAKATIIVPHTTMFNIANAFMTASFLLIAERKQFSPRGIMSPLRG